MCIYRQQAYNEIVRDKFLMKNTSLSSRVPAWAVEHNVTKLATNERTEMSFHTQASLNEEPIATRVYSICMAIYMDDSDLNTRALVNESEIVLELSQASLSEQIIQLLSS